MRKNTVRRTVIIVIAVVAVAAALGAALVRWYIESDVVRAGDLRESEARELCEDGVRGETGFGEDAEFDTWNAEIVQDADLWVIDGQVFSHAVEGEDVTYGARGDGVEFECRVGADGTTVTLGE